MKIIDGDKPKVDREISNLIAEIYSAKYDENPDNKLKYLYDQYLEGFNKCKDKYDNFESYLIETVTNSRDEIVSLMISTKEFGKTPVNKFNEFAHSMEEFRGGLYKGFPRDDRRKNDKNKLPNYRVVGNTVRKDTGCSAFQEYKMRVKLCTFEMVKLKNSRVRLNSHTLGVVNRNFILGKTSYEKYLLELEELKHRKK